MPLACRREPARAPRTRKPHPPATIRRMGLGDAISGVRHFGRARFYDEFARMLEAGLPLRAALRAIAAPSGDPIARAAERIEERIRRGASLAEAIAEEVPSLEPFERHAIEGAERSGRLPETLRRLSAHFRARGEAIARVALGLLYPVALVHLAILLPNAALLFWNGVAAYARAVAPPLFALWGGALGAILLGRALARSPAGRRWLGAVGLRLPGVGRLLRAQAFADYVEALELLFRAGVPAGEALERAAGSLREPALAEAGRRIADAVGAGRKLAEAFEEEAARALVPRWFAESARIAEESGAYDETFEKAARAAREDADRRLRRLSVAIPVIVYLAVMAYIAALVIRFYSGFYRSIAG